MKQKKSHCKRDYIAAFNYSCNLKCVALMYGFKKTDAKKPCCKPCQKYKYNAPLAECNQAASHYIIFPVKKYRRT